MGTITYERPREKLYQKGVSALTNSELLQIIIGSGNAGMPVTKIARKVDRVLKKNGLSVKMNDLTTVQGLGLVKAGQIIAGLELAHRLAYQESDEPYKEVDLLTDLYTDIRNSKKRMLLYAFFDGNGRLLDDYTQLLDSKVSVSRIARKMFADALAQSAASILVAVGGKDQSLEPTLLELSLAREVYSTASVLSIRVKSFVLVGVSGEYAMKEVSHG